MISLGKIQKANSILFILLLLMLFPYACRKVDTIEQELAENAAEQAKTDQQGDESEELDLSDFPDWTEATHSNDVDPDYSVVFNQTEVLRLDITISSDNWSAMQADLASLLGASTGTQEPPPGPPPGGGGEPGGEPAADLTEDPIWIDCTLKFDGKEWYHVGIRCKGNSSLRSTYQMGIKKFSFKLDFDEFEDDYPVLKNQRFYGFKQLNLNNNYDDKSLMREKVASDLFREFGLASAQTAFCVLYIDNGTGQQYYGVYTIVEEVDDTVIETQFTDGSGNLYKPEGTAATFSSGSYNETEMYLKTNEETADYSDVLALYNTINSSDRTSNVSAWRTSLESVFNVDIFLKWLAANTTIQNWDTYGVMNHNFYLYNNPANGLLTWMPWDNNEALQDGKMGGALSLGLTEVGSGWPLISYIIDQADYKDAYETYLNQFITNVFSTSKLDNTYESYYTLLQAHAYAEESNYTFLQSQADFDNALSELKNHVSQRNASVNSYLQ